MSCNSESLIIENGKVTSVDGNDKCISIPGTVVSFEDGTSSAWVFKLVAMSIETLDFSNANNLENIGAYTFTKCTKIESFDFSKCKKLSTVGTGAFQECSGAVSITFPESPLSVIPDYCFSKCSKLSSFNVPSKVIKTGNFAFEYTRDLKTFTFEKGSIFNKFGERVFYGSGIEVLNLPPSITEFSGIIFRVSHGLKSINIENSEKFASFDGVLYTKNKELVYFPEKAMAIDNPIIRSDTTKICTHAFIGVNSYKSIEIPSKVTTIEYSAFFNFESLTNIIIPATVTSIGESALASCYKLNDIQIKCSLTELPKSLFSTCSSLQVFHIPEGVEVVRENAFEMCTSLNTVYIPVTVTSFGTGVFRGCPSDINLVFAEGSPIRYENEILYNSDMTTLISYMGTSDTVKIISSVNTIANGAFQGKNIVNVIYENILNVKTIQKNAFSECRKIVTIELPKIGVISDYTFHKCQKLETIVIPEGITRIGEYAFYGCSSLNNITIQSNLKTISNFSFALCSSLQSIALPNTVENIESYAFNQCTVLAEFTLPDSIVEIGEHAFGKSGIVNFNYNENIQIENLTRLSICECNELLSFTIPNSVTKLSESSVYNCTKLTSIKLGTKIEVIENYAISNCPMLENIKFGNNNVLSDFSSLSFYDCDSLSYIDTTETDKFVFEDDGMLFDTGKTQIILFLKTRKPTKIIIPGTVLGINRYVFSTCDTIESVEIQGSVLEEIGISAFQGCTSLHDIVFPSSLTTIGTNAFNNCGLKMVSLIHTHLKVLNGRVFANNKKLNHILLPNTIEECQSSSFEGIDPRANVLYYGSNIVLDKAGLSKKASVYCFGEYASDTFLGLPVKRGIVSDLKCTHNIVFRYSHVFFALFTFLIA